PVRIQAVILRWRHTTSGGQFQPSQQCRSQVSEPVPWSYLHQAAVNPFGQLGQETMKRRSDAPWVQGQTRDSLIDQRDEADLVSSIHQLNRNLIRDVCAERKAAQIEWTGRLTGQNGVDKPARNLGDIVGGVILDHAPKAQKGSQRAHLRRQSVEMQNVA